jgi:transposase InsO family protein
MAILKWIECLYSPHRRHSYWNKLSAADYEAAHTLSTST